jgi:hypothetical protein
MAEHLTQLARVATLAASATLEEAPAVALAI